MYVSPTDGGTRVNRQAPRCQPTAFIEYFFRNYSITLPDLFCSNMSKNERAECRAKLA